MLWSPDNQRLAISFAAATLAVNYEGLFLANLNGSHSEVLLQPEFSHIDPGQFASFTLQWDLQRATAVSLNSLASALSYAWNARDALVPLSLAAEQSSPFAYTPIPPGNPDGGRVFSIWQPGRPGVLQIMHTPGVYLWSTTFAAWSPDGRYLITNFTFTGLIEPPGQAFPANAALDTLGVKDVPRIPEHDPALISAASNARIAAWNPTGTLLAVYDRAGVIDLYTCCTERLLAFFTPQLTRALSGTAALLSWSPDGRFLLLSSAQWGLITLWKTSNLLGD